MKTPRFIKEFAQFIRARSINPENTPGVDRIEKAAETGTISICEAMTVLNTYYLVALADLELTPDNYHRLKEANENR